MITTEQITNEELIEEAMTQDLGPFFENKYGDKYLYSVNGGTFSELAAKDVYTDFFGKDHFKRESLYLVVGTDSGLLINYVLEQGVPEASRFIFLELPEVLERLPEIINLDQLPESIHVTDLEGFSESLNALHARHYIYSKRLFTQPTLSSMDARLVGYSELYAEVQAAMSEAVWNTELQLGSHGFEIRQIENLAENRLSSAYLRDFKDVLKGKTAVVLGVGPSLDDILPWVEQNEHNLFIIAVSRASRRLKEVGISPHIIVSVDPSAYSCDVSRDMFYFSKEAVFIHGPHVSPALVGNWAGKHLYMGARFPWETRCNVPNLPPHGPTVTQTAITVAVEMGFSQVVLGGVDLCFNKEGQVYGKTTQGREKGLNPGSVHGGVETNGGWYAETIHAFVGGARTTGHIAGQAKAMNCRIINSAIGATKIPNVDYIPTDKIILEPLSLSPRSLLSKIYTDNSIEAEVTHCTGMLGELARAKTAFLAIEKLSLKAIEANRNLFARKAKGEKKRIDSIEKKINENFSEYSRFAKKYGILKFLKIIKPGKEVLDDFSDVEKAGQLYYEAYIETARTLIKLIEKGEKRLKLRLEEYEEFPNYRKLIQYWEENQLYGRIRVVESKRPDFTKKANSDELLKLNRLEGKYSRFLSRQEDLSPMSKPKEKDYVQLRNQVQVFFLRKSLSSLRILSDDLASDKSEDGRSLYHLSRGYLMELENNVSDALAYYEQVIEGENHNVLEKALCRVAALSFALKNNENLELAFECLAGLSPLYMPKYADLLWLNGNIEEAFEVYLSYLNRAPNDLLAMVKLGRYYLKAGSLEGGRMACEYVLEKDPENKSAKNMMNDIDVLALEK